MRDLGVIVDLFAGGGGASTGIEAATRAPVDIAINHDEVALAVHRDNHPRTLHLESDVHDVAPRVAVGGRKVRLLWASPDCTHHSNAKGGKPRKQNIRSLAWVVVRWAKDVRPAIICLENVPEFGGWGPLDKDGFPIPSRKGETFRRWKSELEKLGYVVDHRVLDASLFGAPTKRRRLFLVARCDGQPICWPAPTHGKGLEPVHTAAECIDWSIPVPSIFERKRPLAEKTLWRIAQGIKKFVLENPRPFIVRTDHHQSHATNAFPAEQPLGTITSAQGHAVVVPVIAGVGGRAGDSPATPGDAPLGTITAKNDRAVVAPHLVQVNHGKREDRSEALDAPLSTVTASQRSHAVVTPVLTTIDQQGSGPASTSPEAPLPTTTTKNRHAVVAPTLVQTSYGERPGQRPRYLDLHEPLGTVVAQGQKHALVSAFLNKHFGERHPGEVQAADLREPMPTVTSRDHNSLTAVALAHFRGTAPNQPGACSAEEPLPTVSAGGIHEGVVQADLEPAPSSADHTAEVRAFLTAYYGNDGGEGKGQDLFESTRTLTAKARLGLVTVEGVDYQITDIGMRMLEPHELLRAQFGKYAAGYDMSAATTKKDQVRLIGNSVCPEVAEAVVRANLPRAEREAA